MRVLLIEDDSSLQRTLQRLFKAQHLAADVASKGREGIFLATTNDYDVIVLDIMLPDIDGFAVCRALRMEDVQTPVIMLTALDEVESRIKGLDTGADDYLAKPFHAGELLARIRALSRRIGGRSPVLTVADLELDPLTHKVHRSGRRVDLSAKEFSLLEHLLRNKNRVVTRTEIGEHVWDLNFDPRSNVIDAFVKLVRRKIDADYEPKLIRTIRGVGYCISDKE